MSPEMSPDLSANGRFTPALQHTPPWRPCHDPGLADLRVRDERDNSLFAAILRRAGNDDTPLEELFLDTALLASEKERESFLPEARAYAEQIKARSLLSESCPQQDSEGNPLWISLTLRNRRDDERVESPKRDASLRGFVKMLVFGAVLALIWYFFGQSGIVSRFFSA